MANMGFDGDSSFKRPSKWGDWTTWSFALVLLPLLWLSVICLLPFTLVLTLVLPGHYLLWTALYFVLLPILFIPGLESLQVFVVARWTREPTAVERSRFEPLWANVLERAGRGQKRRWALRVDEMPGTNAFAAGGAVVAVTTDALSTLNDDQLTAVLAHEYGHHVGFHPILLLAKIWIARPLVWAEWLATLVHNILAGISGWSLHWILQIILFIAIALLHIILLLLNVVLWIATALLTFLGRQAEYMADRVAVKLGYGQGLIDALNLIEGRARSLEGAGSASRLSSIWDTHPPTGRRIAKIEAALRAM